MVGRELTFRSRGSLFAVIDAMEHTVIPSKSCFIVLSDP